ncbi:MAG TPA: hypothetical protein VFN55_01205 [Solirubrobacteraceae bacterium]|nr:hypothetical protein [Solirubrobacteraceae bacterium]
MTATAAVPEAAPAPVRVQTGPTWWPLAVYTVLSLLLFGIPVLGHFATHAVASDAIDSSQFMWFLAWWPHAILHGLNPFVTHAMFVPEGFNLTWSTAMPGPALLLSPVTELFSASVTYNVIQLASPALGAWTMYLLARELTGRTASSLVAGYVFGFSPYMLVHLTGGPYLALVALLPVIIRLIVRRVHGRISPRRFVGLTALCLIAQFSISSEVLATASIFGAVAYLAAWLLMPEYRRVLVHTALLLAGAYAITVVVISPYLYFFFFGHQYPPGAVFFPADVVSFGLPPSLVALGRHSPPFGGSNNESYLGLPLIALILTWIWTERRQRRTWTIVVPMVAAGLCSLGGYLMVRGHFTSIPGVWKWLAHLPILKYAIPVRLSLFVIIPAAIIVALFLAAARSGPERRRSARWRWGLAALAIAFIVPDVGSGNWNTVVRDPAFFSSGEYRHYLRASDNVLTVPSWGPNERWQADTGFAFHLADGYAGNPFPPAYSRYATWTTLLTGHLTPDYAAQLRRFVHDKGVTAIVVDATDPGPWPKLFAVLGVRPVLIGGVYYYRLRG